MTRTLEVTLWGRRQVVAGLAREIRVRAGASQAEVARAARMSKSAVASYEAGRRVPRGPAGDRYCRVLRDLAGMS